MALVQLRIGGAVYTVSCGDGQEKELERLAERVDEKVKSVKSGGFVPENLALVMAALLLANETDEQKSPAIKQQTDTSAVSRETVQQAVQNIEKITQRISMVAQKLENA